MIVEFTYCTSVNDNLPCRNIIGCWKSRTDIVTFLKGHFSDADLRKIFEGPAKTRIDRIIESIKKEESSESQ